jgi:hypothetical protein
MIDPKLNELPADAQGDFANRPDANLSEEDREKFLQQSKAGYSINDTIAGDSELSVGSRGVDVSGVNSGSGAGAGSTNVTPARPGERTTATVAGGERGTGMNYNNDTNYKQN